MPELHIRTGYGGEDTPYLDLKIEVVDVIEEPSVNTYPYQIVGYMEGYVVDSRNADGTVENILDDMVVPASVRVEDVINAWNEMQRFDWNLEKICFVMEVTFD